MNVKIGTPRWRQTSKSLRVCGSMPLAGVDHHHHRIDRGQHAIGVLGKILVAGGVEQVDAVAVVIELQTVELMEMPRFLSSSIQSEVVARWFLRAVTEPASCTAPPYKQELFRQRGFARVRMRDDGERAPLLNFFAMLTKGRGS